MLSAAGEMEKTVLAIFTKTKRVVMISAIRPGMFSGEITKLTHDVITNRPEGM